MSTLVDTITGELDERRQRAAAIATEILKLEEMLDLAGQLDEPTVATPVQTPPPSTKPRVATQKPKTVKKATAVKTPARRTSLISGGFLANSIVELLTERGPLGAVDIAAALTAQKLTVNVAVKSLVETRVLSAEGKTRGRKYFVTANRDRELATNGHAKTSGLLKSQGSRQRVIDAIAADPGELNEDRIALALDLDREDVAVICGDLLVDDNVTLNPDGTYLPNRALAAVA